MSWLLLTAAILVAMFALVLLFGAPYLPTLHRQQQVALELLDLKPGQTLLELGSGDGCMLITAARQGIRAVGYELNPALVVYSWIVTRRHASLITVRWANFWQVRLPASDGVYVFLQDRFMDRLHNKITQEISSPVKLVSYAFQIPGLKHTTEKNGMFLYKFNNKS